METIVIGGLAQSRGAQFIDTYLVTQSRYDELQREAWRKTLDRGRRRHRRHYAIVCPADD
jgi:hypothetical protein